MKLFLGPMSLNIIKAVIEFAEENNIKLGFIPSRRQIDYDGGYVEDFNTEKFNRYVKDKTNKIKIFRDHGGDFQGKSKKNDCFTSFYADAIHLDFIHLDPFMKCKNINQAAKKTAEYLKFCNFINPNIYYEIGTEQSIREISEDELEEFIINIKNLLNEDQFNKIKYLVIQSGTKLKDGKNIGIYNKNKLKNMIDLSRRYNLRSKEHNGDYQDPKIIKEKFNLGLDCINIAPELASIESSAIIEQLDSQSINELFYQCLISKKWKKWISKDFKPKQNKKELIKICCHYIFSTENFKQFKKKYLPDAIDITIRNKIKDKIKKILF